MSAQWQRVHERLMAQLPVRTIQRETPEEQPRDYTKQVKPDAATLAAAERSGRVRIGSATYDSIAHAARKRRTPIKDIYKLIKEGSGRYL